MPIETPNSMPDVPAAASTQPDESERQSLIAVAAYYRAERRGFAPGREVEDWLEAERELQMWSAAIASPRPAAAPQAMTEPAVSAAARATAKARTSRGSAGSANRR